MPLQIIRPDELRTFTPARVLHSDWAAKTIWLENAEGCRARITWELAENLYHLVPADPLGREWLLETKPIAAVLEPIDVEELGPF